MDLDDEDSKLFEWLREDFIYSRLCLPDGSIIKKISGVPSGSFMTLLINTMANYIMQMTIFESAGIPIIDRRSLGDDFSIYTSRIPEKRFVNILDDICLLGEALFGIIIKPEKVIITNVVSDRKFIGYMIRNGKLFREEDDYFKQILYTEVPISHLNDSFTRVFSTYLIGGYYYTSFVRFLEKYMGGYYKYLEEYGKMLISPKAMRKGSMKLLKQIHGIDFDQFEGLTISGVRAMFHAKVPYYLILGARIT